MLEYMDNPDIGRMATLAYRVVAQTGYNYLSTHGDQLETMEPTYKENDYISVFKQVILNIDQIDLKEENICRRIIEMCVP